MWGLLRLASTKRDYSSQTYTEFVWDRFANCKGGHGNNIPCDLYNEHVNRIVKEMINDMGSNLTEQAVERAARSVSVISSVAEEFDNVSQNASWLFYSHQENRQTQHWLGSWSCS